MPLTGSTQRVDVALALARVVKVVAHDHVPHAETCHQQLLFELRGAEVAHACVETQHHDAVDPVERERLELLAQPHQARGRRRALEEFARSRLERDHGDRHAEFIGLAPRGLEHVLVAAMHPVVIADRRDAAAVLGTQVVQPADQFERTTHGFVPSDRGGTTIFWCRRSPTRMPSTYNVPK